MSFAFVEDNVIQEYPVSIGQIKERFPNTSFSSDWENSDLSGFGVVRVANTEEPAFDQYTQRVEEVTPTFSDNEWRRTYSVVSLTDDERQTVLSFKEDSVRAERNEKLALSDWTQLSDSSANTAAWATYRQALRDLPTTDGWPHNITWPTEPS